MSFLNSIKNNSKKYETPFDHWEYSNALSEGAIEEIVKADIPDLSQHNLNYWQFGDFLGVGPGSHSKISNKQEIIRYRKIRPLEGYIQNQKSADLKTIAGNELDMDLAMNLLRIKNGLQHQDITIDLPASFLKKYQRGVDEGLLLKDKIGATQKGYQFLNETIQLFF